MVSDKIGKTPPKGRTAAPGLAGMDETPLLSEGAVLGANFRIERFVAAGGMGQVFRARDIRLDRPVALKVLHQEGHQRKSDMARFKREALLLSRVVHPNVVATFEVGEHEGSPYLVMEYVDGPTLSRYIRGHQRLSVEETIRLVGQIASGLEEAHALGIIHRDVKPGNILLHRLRSAGMLAKVVDFGLAYRTAGEDSDPSLTAAAELIGSPLYMSPEQIEGQELDGRSDLYSLALVTYEMLVGSPPFLGDTLQAILKAHLTRDVPSLKKVVSHERVEELDQVMSIALSKDPGDRYQSVGAFVQALREASGYVDQASTGGGTECDVCFDTVSRGDRFCGSCGAPSPLQQCAVCGTERHGRRYHCINCHASLIPGSRKRAASTIAGQGPSKERAEVVSSTGVALVLDIVDARATSKMLADIHELFSVTVERERGRPVAILGREALAVFGIGGMREREVERAVDAALALLRGVCAVFDDAGYDWSSAEVRIGLEMGRIETRGVGLSWGTALVSGEGIDGARTLIRSCIDSGVFLGKLAWREVKSIYDGEATPGGHRVLARRRVPIMQEPSLVGGQPVPFVGRDYEIAHLVRAFERVVRTRKLVVVPVIGAPGVGKSRLLAEFLVRLNQKSTFCNVDLGRCIPSEEAVPFAPFRAAFRNRYPIYDEDDAKAVEELLTFLPGLRDLPRDAAARRASHLRQLLGLGRASAQELQPSHESLPARSPSDSEQVVAFEAYTEYVRSYAAEAPYVLVLDDLQWVRPTTLKLLSYLAEGCIQAPVMLVLAVRDRDAAKTLSSVQLPTLALSSVELSPFQPEDLAVLAEGLFGAGVLSPPLLATLYELTGGLPQEVEAHLEALVEEGSLCQEGETWTYRSAADPDSQQLPGSLRELVEQRVARLGPEEQRLLRTAALAGQTFTKELLSAMVGRSVDEAELDELVREGWLKDCETGDFLRSRELGFRQDRIRDILLDAHSDEQAKTLHLKAASWLDSRKVDMLPAVRTARLARHYKEAGQTEEGSQHTLHRAKESLNAFASTEAYEGFGEALAMAQTMAVGNVDEMRAQVILEAALGRAHTGWILGEHAEALTVLDNVEELVQGETSSTIGYRMRVLRGDILSVQGHHDQAAEIYANLLEKTQSLVSIGFMAQVRGRLAMKKVEQRDFEAAETYAQIILDEESEKLFSDPSWCRGAGSATGVLARIAMEKKEYPQARELYQQSRLYRQQADDPVGAAMAQLGEGNTYFLEKNLEEAGGLYGASARELREIGFRFGAAVATNNLGEVSLLRGNPAEAMACLEESEETMRSLHSYAYLVEVLRLKSLCLEALDKVSEALAVAEEGLQLAQDKGIRYGVDELEAQVQRFRQAL